MTSNARPRASRWISLIIFGVILALWLLQTKTIHESWNESSRLAAVQSLVEYGTWHIDHSPYGHETGDKMVLDGHYYSEKPPLFAALGAIFYSLIHYGLDGTLAITGCQQGAICVYYWLTVLMVGIPSALMAALFYRLALPLVSSIGWAVGLTLLLCFGTVVWPYSLVFNHHLPAAIAIFVVFYLLFAEHQNWHRVFWAGLLAGMAVMLDLTSIFLAFSLFLIVAVYHRRESLFFLAGGLIPVAVTAVFNYQITGGPLFAYFSYEGYSFPGSPWASTVGGQHPPDNVLLYAFRSFVGDRGLFGYSPLLIFAAIGLFLTVIKRDQPRQIWGKSALILLGIGGHLLFVLTQTNHFGGDAYGWRFLIPFIPTLYFFMVFIVRARFYNSGGKWLAALWGVAAVVSIYSAYQGVQATWHQFSPPFYLVLSPTSPYLTLKTNLEVPDYEPIARNQQTYVHNFEMPLISNELDVNLNDEVMLLGYDLPKRRIEPGQNLELVLYWQSLRVVPGDYFVFTHLVGTDQTQLGGLDRRLQEGYPLAFWYPGEIVEDRRLIPVTVDAANGLAWLRIGAYQVADDTVAPVPLVEDGQVTNSTSIALGPILIGTPPQVIPSGQFDPQTPLSIELGQPPVISLRGYDLTREENGLHVTLYWENLAPTPIDWTTFVHLRNDASEVVAQNDGPTGNGNYPTSLWQPGEVVADHIVMPIEHLPFSRYSLFVGLYDLATGNRLAVPDNPADEIVLMTLDL